jgi:hypothetical protein
MNDLYIRFDKNGEDLYIFKYIKDSEIYESIEGMFIALIKESVYLTNCQKDAIVSPSKKYSRPMLDHEYVKYRLLGVLDGK